ncbi:MAG: NIPSNAP family protein [Pseudolabrys sp.]
MLVDVRTYTIRPGCTPAQLELYEKYGFPVQVRHIGQPLAYLQAESGEMNTLVHLWVYDSAADREKRRAAQAADPDWKVYLDESRKAGYMASQRTTLMTPVKFCPPLRR